MARVFGLLGYPLSHSFSKPYFTKKFESLGLSDHRFVLFETETLDNLKAKLAEFPELAGFSVTIPHKENIIPMLDDMDETAAKIGAVNCVKVSLRDGKQILKGFNTDAVGFKNSIRPFLEPQHNRALILGTGGVAKAIRYALKQIGVDVWFVTRKKVGSSENILEYSEINEHVMRAFQLVINCTPLGMDNYPGAPDIPYDLLNAQHFCYDVIYNPEETDFLKRARLQGAQTMNGLDMLYQQAEAAWIIWNS